MNIIYQYVHPEEGWRVPAPQATAMYVPRVGEKVRSPQEDMEWIVVDVVWSPWGDRISSQKEVLVLLDKEPEETNSFLKALKDNAISMSDLKNT